MTNPSKYSIIYRLEKTSDLRGKQVKMNIFLAILALVGGFVLLIKGADWFVDGAAGVAAKLRIPALVIGLHDNIHTEIR